MSRGRPKNRRAAERRQRAAERQRRATASRLSTFAVERCGRKLTVLATTELDAIGLAGGSEPVRHETWGDGVTRFTAVATWSLRRENFYVRRVG